jgi:hypothetical protein
LLSNITSFSSFTKVTDQVEYQYTE